MGGCRPVTLVRWCEMCCLAGAIVLPSSVWAENRPSTACRFEGTGTGKVRTITDGRSFVLDDGREIRLAGIEVPFPPAAGESGTRAVAGLSARTALASIVADREVELRRNGAVADRYGRALAFVHLGGDGAPRSVAHEMLGRGFALFSADVGDRACADELLAQERSARQAKLGLWGEPYYVILGAGGLAELEAERGHFTVVEGKVLSVRESGGTIYVNFGRQWSQALTVTILKRHERTFTAAGMEPKKLENRRLRVRGWIEERNGPRIEATHPEQIELAERN
jgi:endonuclease YncB( thermonuclease family)